MQLNVAECQHFHLGPGAAPDFKMPKNTRWLSPLPRMKQFPDLGVVIESSLKFSVHVSKAISKARQGLAKLNSDIPGVILQLIIRI